MVCGLSALKNFLKVTYLFLNAATDQDSDRSWVVNHKKLGTIADFTPLNSDIDAALAAAISSLKGDAAAEYDTLGKVEDVIIANKVISDDADAALAARLDLEEPKIIALEAGIELRPEFKVQSDVFTQNGSNYELEFANPFNSTEVQIQVQSDESLGSYHALTGTEVDIHVTASLIAVTTQSPTIGGHTVKVLMSGIVVA